MPLTVYELSALSKQLRLEQHLIKKYQFYSSISTDTQLKLKFEQISADHKSHYDKLITYLN